MSEEPRPVNASAADRSRLALIGAAEQDAAAGLRLDQAARRAYVSGRELPLTTQLFDLLTYFLDHRGEAVSFESLAAEVWAYPHGGTDHHFLHTAVYRLRRILQAEGVENLITGIRGFGYRVSSTPVVPIKIAATSRAIAVFDPADPDLRLSMANEAVVGLTGYSVEALTRLPNLPARLWSPEDLAIIQDTVTEALAVGTAMTAGRTLVRSDSSTVCVDVSMTRLDLPGLPPLCMAEVTRAG